MAMKVTPIAATILIQSPESVHETAMGNDLDDPRWVDEIDVLHEFAGRACYKSWEKPNPATRENHDYLAHIIDSQHESVLEHGAVTFYVEGVSRSLLLELERHRHLSFSVESQRYVNTVKHHPLPVVPPLFTDLTELGNDAGVVAQLRLRKHYQASLALYEETYRDMRDADIPVKQAREAARAFLPNATPVDFVVTANIRTWRYVIAKRTDEGADAEIRQFAEAIESELADLAPASIYSIRKDK